jgi:hypothetical protein
MVPLKFNGLCASYSLSTTVITLGHKHQPSRTARNILQFRKTLNGLSWSLSKNLSHHSRENLNATTDKRRMLAPPVNIGWPARPLHSIET